MELRTSLFARWLINAVAIWAAIKLVPGIHPISTDFFSIALIALIFGLVNALIRPLVMLMTCPLIILTLGLGTLLVNAAMFWLAGQIGSYFSVGFTTDGFGPAFWGALIVTIISAVLSTVLGEPKHERRHAD